MSGYQNIGSESASTSFTTMAGVLCVSLSVGALVGLTFNTTPAATSLYTATTTTTTTPIAYAALPRYTAPTNHVRQFANAANVPDVRSAQYTKTASAVQAPSRTADVAIVGFMAAMVTVVGALMAKIWGGHKRAMAMAAHTGRKSMALSADTDAMPFKDSTNLPMNCRSVDPNEPGWRMLGKIDIPLICPRRALIDDTQQWLANEHKERIEEEFPGFRVSVDDEQDRIVEEDTFSLTARFTGPMGEHIVIEYCLDNAVIKTARTIEGFNVEDKERAKFVNQMGQEDPRTLTMMGTSGEARGQTFIIRRDDSITLPETLRPVLGQSLKELSEAINRYYAFGNMFLDDTS